MNRSRTGILAARTKRVAPLCLLLAACTPTTRSAGEGVGFQDYNSYVRGAVPAPAGAPVTVVPPGSILKSSSTVSTR